MVLAFSTCTGQITTVNDLQRRRRAGNKTLHFVVGNSSKFSALAKEIHLHPSIEKLIIEPECIYKDNESWPSISEPRWTSNGAVELFQALGKLPMLTSIHLKDLGTFGEDGVGLGIPLRLLSTLLSSPSRGCQLKELVVEKCRFTLFSQACLQDFTATFSGLNALERLQWDERFVLSTFEIPQNNGAVSKRAVISTLLQLPSLREVHIQTTLPYGMQPACVGVIDCDIIGASRVRESVSVRNFKLTSKAANVLADRLRRADCPLKNLQLDLGSTKAENASAIFEAMYWNTSIQALEFGISYHQSWKQQRCLLRLANALTGNHTASTVRLQHFNTSLSSSTRRQFTEEDAHGFVHMLESNISIKHLQLDDYNPLYDEINQGELAPMIDLYTNLNINGRKDILRQDCKHQLIEVLAASASSNNLPGLLNIEALRYWLKQKPTLFVC